MGLRISGLPHTPDGRPARRRARWRPTSVYNSSNAREKVLETNGIVLIYLETRAIYYSKCRLMDAFENEF